MQLAVRVTHRRLLALAAVVSLALAGSIAARHAATPEVQRAVTLQPHAIASEPEAARVVPAQEPALAIVVATTSTSVPVGKPLPLRFTVVNRTNQTLPVLRSLDASDVGWRYPKIDIIVRDHAGKRVEVEARGRCGLMNPLTAKDFVELAPREQVDLFGEDMFDHHVMYSGIATPGRYTITLRYDLSFSGDDAPHDDDIAPLLAKLPKGVYESAPIELEVHGF